MAQLTDDCFAFGGRLIPLDEALAAARPQFPAIDGREELPLHEALGRLAASDLRAPRAVPPHDNSAVDGYALRFEDLSPEGPTTLPLEGYAAAGDRPSPLRPGKARRILTGAALPPGADTVFMDEDVEVLGGDEPAETGSGSGSGPDHASARHVRLPAGLKKGANARQAGEDVAQGDLVIKAGQRLGAADLGLLASLGLTRLSVRRRLRVALFSTGNEIKDPGQTLEPGQVYDANRYALRGLLEQAGAEVLDLGILADEAAEIEAALGALTGEKTADKTGDRTGEKTQGPLDLILTSGGVSAGDHDVVRHVLEAQGELLFWRLAVKPGRPIALGRWAQTPVIGLPGNPAAAAVMFFVAVLPLLRAREGALWSPPPALPVRLDFSHKKKADRVEFVRVQVRPEADGTLSARKFPREGAGILSSIAWADGLVALEPDRLVVEPGQTGLYTAFDWSLSA